MSDTYTALTPSGVRIKTKIPNRGGSVPRGIAFGDTFEHTDQWLMQVRAADAFGAPWAVAKTWSSTPGVPDHAMLVSPGEPRVGLGPAHGSNPVAIRLIGEVLVIAVVRSATQWVKYTKQSRGEIAFAGEFEIGTPEKRSSQGILALDAQGAPIWLDTNDHWLGLGLHLRHPRMIHDYVVGLEQTRDRIMMADTVSGLVYDVGPFSPVPVDVAMVQGQLYVAVSVPEVWVTQSEFTLASNQRVPPPMAEPPAPEPPPPQAVWPTKAWFAPYHSYTFYGDAPQPLGNAQLITGKEDTPEEWIVQMERAVQRGLPIIAVPPPRTLPQRMHATAAKLALHNLLVAWWVAGATPEALAAEVSWALWQPRALPIHAYLDSREWPQAKPAWLTEDRIWPNIQCYKGLTESVGDYAKTLSATIAKVKAYGNPVGLTVQAYDRNFRMGLGEVVATLNATVPLVTQAQPVAIFPFADRRPGGMEAHPRLREIMAQWAKEFVRPTRYDFWTGPGLEALRAKLRGDSTFVSLTPAEKAVLIKALEGM